MNMNKIIHKASPISYIMAFEVHAKVSSRQGAKSIMCGRLFVTNPMKDKELPMHSFFPTHTYSEIQRYVGMNVKVASYKNLELVRMR